MRREAISRLTRQPRSSRSRKSKIAHRLPRTWPPIRCCSLGKHNVSAISVGRHGVINHKISDSTVNDFNALRISLKVSKPDHCHQPPLLGAARGVCNRKCAWGCRCHRHRIRVVSRLRETSQILSGTSRMKYVCEVHVTVGHSWNGYAYKNVHGHAGITSKLQFFLERQGRTGLHKL